MEPSICGRHDNLVPGCAGRHWFVSVEFALLQHVSSRAGCAERSRLSAGQPRTFCLSHRRTEPLDDRNRGAFWRKHRCRHACRVVFAPFARAALKDSGPIRISHRLRPRSLTRMNSHLGIAVSQVSKSRPGAPRFGTSSSGQRRSVVRHSVCRLSSALWPQLIKLLSSPATVPATFTAFPQAFAWAIISRPLRGLLV